MPDLSKAFTTISLQTNMRSLHKLYEAMYGVRNGKILTIEGDGNLTDLFHVIEQVLVRSGYMTDAELRAIRAPLHGIWEVKGG